MRLKNCGIRSLESIICPCESICVVGFVNSLLMGYCSKFCEFEAFVLIKHILADAYISLPIPTWTFTDICLFMKIFQTLLLQECTSALHFTRCCVPNCLTHVSVLPIHSASRLTEWNIHGEKLMAQSGMIPCWRNTGADCSGLDRELQDNWGWFSHTSNFRYFGFMMIILFYELRVHAVDI